MYANASGREPRQAIIWGIGKNSVQFDYFRSNYQKFVEDFYAFANMSIPPTFLTGDILKRLLKMNKLEKNSVQFDYFIATIKNLKRTFIHLQI